jgi:hypothetical protein
MPTTPTYALRYPQATDPADVPSDMQKLASDVDGALGAVGIPKPVVNGQWVKGSGGAAVWSPIAASDVPGLTTYAQTNVAGVQDVPWTGGSAVVLFDEFGGGASASIRSYGEPPRGNGTVLVIRNQFATNVTLVHGASGLAAGQAPFYMAVGGAGLNTVLGAGMAITFVYDGAWTEASRDTFAFNNNASQVLKGNATWDYALRQIVGTSMDARSSLQYGYGNLDIGTATAAAPWSITIGLPFAWQNAHPIFWGTVWPNGTWNGFSVISPGNPINLSQGSIAVVNSAQAQNVTARWCSIGW